MERHAREVLVAWCADLVAAPAPVGVRVESAVAEAVRSVVAELAQRHPELTEHQRRILSKLATAARGEGRLQDALHIFETIAPRDHASEALCHEQLGNYASAAQSHERAGDFGSALSALRRIPDVPGALRLAELLNHEDLPALRWLSRYCTVMESLDPHMAAKLTTAERRLVAGVRDDALLEAAPPEPVAPAAVAASTIT